MTKSKRHTAQPSLPNHISLKLSWYGGSGLGLLFGVIMGISTTATVAMVLGALTTLLAAVLGLNDKYCNNAKSIRIGAFGFACVMGVCCGIIVRSHDLLSPSLASLKQQYVSLGFSETQALDFISRKTFGVSSGQPLEQQSAQQSEPQQQQQQQQQHSSMLFSAAVQLSGCDELQLTDTVLTVDEVINNFELTGGGWQQLAFYVSNHIAPPQRKAMLLTVKDAICLLEPIEQERCGTLITELTVMSQLNASWQPVVQSINASTLTASQKLTALGLAQQVLCGFDFDSTPSKRWMRHYKLPRLLSQ